MKLRSDWRCHQRVFESAKASDSCYFEIESFDQVTTFGPPTRQPQFKGQTEQLEIIRHLFVHCYFPILITVIVVHSRLHCKPYNPLEQNFSLCFRKK